MTPLSRLLARLLPPPLVLPALVLAYAGALLAVGLTLDLTPGRIVYVDAGVR